MLAHLETDSDPLHLSSSTYWFLPERLCLQLLIIQATSRCLGRLASAALMCWLVGWRATQETGSLVAPLRGSGGSQGTVQRHEDNFVFANFSKLDFSCFFWCCPFIPCMLLKDISRKLIFPSNLKSTFAFENY